MTARRRRGADTQRYGAEQVWYLAICHQCTPVLAQPFSDKAERETWVRAHLEGTGHALTLITKTRP